MPISSNKTEKKKMATLGYLKKSQKLFLNSSIHMYKPLNRKKSRHLFLFFYEVSLKN